MNNYNYSLKWLQFLPRMSHLSRTNFGMVEGQGSNCLSEMIAIVEKNMFARSKNLFVIVTIGDATDNR